MTSAPKKPDADRRAHDLRLRIGLFQMAAAGIEDRAAERERLAAARPMTDAEALKTRRRMYNAVARAKAKREEAGVMLRQLAEIERAAVDLDALGL